MTCGYLSISLGFGVLGVLSVMAGVAVATWSHNRTKPARPCPSCNAGQP